ncbi:hypothetical protein [Desulfocurvus vexinensis]|uniref:hypothetical protein n=1 Tax=Desulfocurvus vexinensis TaxID=399548 RepID=UPI00055212DD|nr:hypothetical protein [Desulfocurvus vexinensis]
MRVYDGEVVTTTTDRPARLLDGRAVVGLAGVASGPTGEVDLAKVSPVRINCGRTSSVALELAELSPERT